MGRPKAKWNPGSGKPHERPVTETPLKAWMERESLTAYALSTEIGLPRKTLENWMHGRNLPPLHWAFKLELFTKGAVPASSWLATDLGREQWRMDGTDATR